MSDIAARLRRQKSPLNRKAAAEITRLRELLAEANDAFDECTGDYAKELTAGELWRADLRRGGVGVVSPESPEHGPGLTTTEVPS